MFTYIYNFIYHIQYKMEKLLNLLQEFYWENRKFSNENWLLTMTNWVENLSGAYAQTYIISKQGWLIEWLMSKEKINQDELENVAMGWFYDESPIYSTPLWTDRLTMILSVEGEPFEVLVSLLK